MTVRYCDINILDVRHFNSKNNGDQKEMITPSPVTVVIPACSAFSSCIYLHTPSNPVTYNSLAFTCCFVNVNVSFINLKVIFQDLGFLFLFISCSILLTPYT